MSHKFPLKEIAFQAGVSLATVDRVVNGRGGVRLATTKRIEASIVELQRQSESALQTGTRFTIDVVMETPKRFSQSVRNAFEAEVPALRPASFRCRFHTSEVFGKSDTLSILKRIRSRGSHGVVLKASGEHDVAVEVNRLVAAGIPVVTYVTDIPQSKRIAYVGVDNEAAGRTAAFLIGNFINQRAGRVLLSMSSDQFVGERERDAGFRAGFKQSGLKNQIVSISEGFGKDQQTGAQVAALVEAQPDICAVYSIGGGNRAIVNALGKQRMPCICFIGHDLDDDNVDLLRSGSISMVIQHDLRQDARSACQLILKYHRLLPGDFVIAQAAIGITTAHNLPERSNDLFPR